VKRYLAILENQTLAVRKRWLMASFIGGIMEGMFRGASAGRHRATAAVSGTRRSWRPE
jgi:hypothetical protein